MLLLHGVTSINGKSHKDNFYHTLEVLDNICKTTNDLWLRWAAILHDIAKPQTKRFEPEHGWTFHGHEDRGSTNGSKDICWIKTSVERKNKYVQKLVLLHLRPIVLAKTEVTDSAIRRLLFEAGDDIDDWWNFARLILLRRTNIKFEILKNFELVREKLKEVEEKDNIRNWQPPVSGEDIMKTFNIQPAAKWVSLKNAIRESDIRRYHSQWLRKGISVYDWERKETGVSGSLVSRRVGISFHATLVH